MGLRALNKKYRRFNLMKVKIITKNTNISSII